MLDVVEGVLGESQLVPGHEETPLYVHPHTVFHVGNWTVLSHLDHLFCSHYCSQLCIDVFSAPIIVSSWITVVSDDIHELVTWIPVNLGSAPCPNEIVDAVMLCETDVQELI